MTTTTDYNKLLLELWNKLPKDEKVELQRKYQINRDQKLQNKVNENHTNHTNQINPNPSTVSSNLSEDEKTKFQDETDQIAALPNNYQPRYSEIIAKMKQDCYLPSEGFLNNNDDINDIINKQ